MKPDKNAKHTVMPIECAWCGIPLGEKNGEGVEGTTSGICPDCLEIEYLLLARQLVKEKKLSWEEAKKRSRDCRERVEALLEVTDRV
jgi:uncharacterized Zn finger protein (UPF0148 family)